MGGWKKGIGFSIKNSPIGIVICGVIINVWKP